MKLPTQAKILKQINAKNTLEKQNNKTCSHMVRMY